MNLPPHSCQELRGLGCCAVCATARAVERMEAAVVAAHAAVAQVLAAPVAAR